MSAKHENVEALFDEALKLQPEERAALVANACADNAGLRRRLEELLRAAENAGDFLPESPNDRSVATSPVTEQPGDRIGRYKLLEKIGEGGCGIVFMAEQEEPVRRRVALKVIKPGMDTKSVIARFEAERQALAMMDHPNIAKVHDGGITESGRPYFVMELVRGIRITQYCQEHRLAMRERLDLFTAVCSAVQHAHQKGIIHRDLKPSNILVSELDGRPVPKVIDFGIAKATEQKLTDKTLFTQFAQFVGTPAYMSPEQAAMTIADIDTRSDIYSLGVLLYELLTGSTPFDTQDLLEAGFDEMRRIIRETEPQKPSTRLTQNARSGSHPSPVTHHPSLPTDLDWIVMKCLEKDRQRRYETATGLAADIQRHLSSEPVTARPASAAYRFRKMIRRNKVAFAAAAAVLAALVVGLGVSVWQSIEKSRALDRAQAAEKAQREQRRKAETEAEKSRQVAQFLKDMLNGVGPSVALGDDTKLLRRILESTAERIGADLKDQPEVEAELRNTLGAVYLALGEYGKSETMRREALALRRNLWGNEHPDVATSLNNLASVLGAQGKLTEAESIHREALAMRRKLLGGEHSAVATSLTNLATVLHDQGKLTEAETMHREALAMQRKLSGNEHPHVNTALNNLALLLHDKGKPAEAETMLRESLAMQRKLSGNEHPGVATSLSNLANIVEKQGKLAEAETMYREALGLQRKLLGNEHKEVAAALNGLALTLNKQGQSAEAETLLREAVSMARKVLGDEHPDLARIIANLALVQEGQRKYAEAETFYREALAMSRKLLGNQHPDVATGHTKLALVLEKQGHLAGAETIRREALAIARGSATDDPPGLEIRITELAENLYRQSKFAEAEPLYRNVIESRKARLDAGHNHVIGAGSGLARLFADWAWSERGSSSAIQNQKPEITERAREAERLLRNCLAIWLRGGGTNAAHWTAAEFRSRLGGALVAVAVTDSTLTGEARIAKFKEAEPLLLESHDALQQNQKVETKFKRDSLSRLVRLYESWGQPDKAGEWHQKLTGFDEAEAAGSVKPSGALPLQHHKETP